MNELPDPQARSPLFPDLQGALRKARQRDRYLLSVPR
jgi:hypothetical protein